jgi:predicted enzyme related to lactoylglutathione lyase
MMLGFYTDDIVSLRERLISKGIEVTQIESRSIGKTAELKDPEGNIVGLQQLPANSL